MSLRPGQSKGPYVGNAINVTGSGVTGGTLVAPTTVPTWVHMEFDYTQFNGTAALTKSNTLFSLLPRQTIEGVVVKTKTAWAGVGITALTFSLGIAGALNKYFSPYDGVPAVTSVNFGTADTFGLEDFVGATNILVSAIATGANLNLLTAGVTCVYIKTSQLIAP